MNQNNLQSYADEGFLTRVNIFSESEISHFRDCFNELEDREGREKCQIGLQARHLEDEFIWQLATDTRIVDGDPRGMRFWRFETPISDVLVPGDELFGVGIGIFAKEVGR